MENRIDVVCLGRTALDILCVMDGFPEPDTKIELSGHDLQGGGPAATAAVTLQRLGFSTSFVGKVCDDAFGRFMLDSLRTEGVDTRGVLVQKGGVSQFACIAVDRTSGARTILWTDGDVSGLTVQELNRDLLQGVRALHVDGHNMQAAILAARTVRQAGGIVSYDGGTHRPGSDELASVCNIVIGTERFARALTGRDDTREALVRMRRGGVEISGITLGANGSMAYDGRAIVQRAAFAVDALDTTGAGDVYHGAFLAARLLGRDLEGCVALAGAAAALKCTKLGGRPGIPSLQEADGFIARTRS